MADDLAAARSVAELAAALVRIPSVNPESAGEPDPEICGEARLAAALAGLLESWSATVELDPIEPARPNLLARFTAAGDRPKLLLAPHLDTVPVAGMSIEPFAGEVRDGRLWGRGACDTKGPMAAMLWALRELVKSGEIDALPWEIHFAAFMGEEVRQPGSAAFAASRGRDYAFALIGEPTERAFVHAHKGSTWITLRARGRAAHASRPELGENAAWALTEALADLRAHWWPAWREERISELLGEPTLSLGLLEGGVQPNIVPASARAVLDLRFTRAEHPGEQLAAWLADRGHQVEVDPGEAGAPLLTPADNPLLQQLSAACGRPLTTAPWFCDGGVLSTIAGIPAAAYGPGSIDQAHTADEWIELAELEAGVDDLLAMMRGG